ncbi:hypothetical protein [Amycolatopsis pigmentata]|uniref:ESX-1 secretion-associated protein n=1 Tax=Amycolatopsis pigmentata TaxID=450801 RepID=A0ABW5FQE8_9PSEU
MESTSINPAAVSACRAELEQTARDLDNVVAGPVPAIGGNPFGDSDDAVRLAKSVRAFDQAVFGQLSRAAALIRAGGDAAGGGARFFHDLDRINARRIGPDGPA